MKRIQEYQKLEQEPIHQGKQARPNFWPFIGKIKFDKVSLIYETKREKALDNIDLTIDSTEKVGVIGRTGAGKTSLIQSLFRLYETEGSIQIDGIDIKNLSLFDLRNALTIIPVISIK